MYVHQKFWIGFLFILPISAVIFLFLLFPILQTVYFSFSDWKGLGDYQFIGLSNYASIINDPSFVRSLNRTLFIGFSIAIGTNILGVILAALLDQAFRSRNILRVMFYLPKLIPIVIAAFVWRFILDSNTGLANRVLSSLTGSDIKILWIDSPAIVVYSIIIISIWQLLGPIMIVYLAALTTVPQELKEASVVDGASPIRQFFSVTLPMIIPAITVNILIGLANGIRLFDLPYALTGGGPANASETLAIKIYKYAFQSGDLAYGMAASFILTLVVLVITILFVSVSKYYEGQVYQ